MKIIVSFCPNSLYNSACVASEYNNLEISQLKNTILTSPNLQYNILSTLRRLSSIEAQLQSGFLAWSTVGF